MKKWLLRGLLLIGLSLVGLFAYGAKGWYDARSDAPMLRERPKQNVMAERLGNTNRTLLIAVEDPTFATNNGIDFSTPGAGQTTMTQSLSKKLAFTKFEPGLGKIRQTGYAIGLGQSLTKEEVLALYLAEAGFKGSDGTWVKGFDAASRRFFGISLDQLDADHFTLLVATLIAPAEMSPDAPNTKLRERVSRIKSLVAGRCVPTSHDDVWLEGCRNIQK
jgi:monofunctional glycosyltransferase